MVYSSTNRHIEISISKYGWYPSSASMSLWNISIHRCYWRLIRWITHCYETYLRRSTPPSRGQNFKDSGYRFWEVSFTSIFEWRSSQTNIGPNLVVFKHLSDDLQINFGIPSGHNQLYLSYLASAFSAMRDNYQVCFNLHIYHKDSSKGQGQGWLCLSRLLQVCFCCIERISFDLCTFHSVI